MNAQTFIKNTLMGTPLTRHTMEVLKKIEWGINDNASLNVSQQTFVLSSIDCIKTELHGNPSKSAGEVALQIATYINTCRG